MVSAWDRFQAHESLDRGWFWRFGNTSDHGSVELEGGTTLEGGGVILVLNGDPTPEPLLTEEQSHWNDLEPRDVIADWDIQWFDPQYENAREKSIQNFGEVGGDRAYRLRPLASRLTLDVLSEFDERLPAVGEDSPDEPVPVGYWAGIHYLMKQQGYDWYDEIDACVKAIENRLRSLAQFHGEDVAQQELDTVLNELNGVDLGI